MQRLKKIAQPLIDIGKRIMRDDVWGMGAMTAFFLTLSVYPLLMFVISMIHQAQHELPHSTLYTLLPASIAELVINISEEVPRTGAVPVVTILISTWAASVGIWALMRGVHRAYNDRSYSDEKPKVRIRARLLSLLFTFAFGIALVVSVAVNIFGRYASDVVSNWLGTGNIFSVVLVQRIIMLGALFMFLSILYRYTPGVAGRIKKHMPGAALAAVAWMVVSWGFEIYMTMFQGTIYGGIGAFLGLMIWIFIICLVVLTGAELNAHIMEKQQEKRAGFAI